jgi:molecular chaperone DnaK
MQPERYVDEIKRHIGDDISLDLGDRSNSPEETSALILQKLVQDASERVGENITDAVITVPAYFTDRQRTATANAAEIAGVNVERLLAEPSAAVLAYGLQKQKLGTDTQETIFVCDLGGGTFDATLVECEYNHNYVETLSTDGNSELGGSDWTARLEELLLDEIEADTGVDLRTASGMAEQYWRVRKSAKEAKHRLSEQMATNVTVPYVVPQEGYSLDTKITRDEFNETTHDLLKSIESPINRVFNDADLGINDVDTVLLIGGASRMPQLSEFIEEYFSMSPSREISPDKAVGLGAAAQASLIDDNTGGIRLSDDGDDTGGLVLADVLPQTLGVVTVDLHQGREQFDPIVEKNTQLPAQERSEVFGTVEYDQTAVSTEIRQGESTTPSENELLGELTLTDIPKREPSEESLGVEFKIGKDGTLTAQAEDLISGKKIETTIDSAVRSSSEEISRKQSSLPTVE